MKRHSFAVGFLIIGVALAGALLGAAAASAGDVAPPHEPGPFNVGVTVFDATMTGGRGTRVQVFYPTLEPADEGFRYTISTPAGPYQLRSALGAVEDAPALPLGFPLVVHDHGGPTAGADFQRVSQFPLHELLASHGFVVSLALHSSDPVARARDLSLVIDVMLFRSADPDDLLAGSIDPTRIGISGHSAGGAAALSASGGWGAKGIVADQRIKAMALSEPSINSLDDAATITIPYLVMGGLQNRNGLAVPRLFDATTLAMPRIYALTPNATHFNYLTSMCSEIDQTREAALLADPTLPEPLTTRTATNAAAARAYDLWNQGEILLPGVGLGGGGGRNYCDRVGVVSVRSLDADGDGFTDSPPLMLDDPLLPLGRAPRAEVMVPLIKLYTVSFWKAFLEGDRRYMEYLTPGYANRNELEALVTIE
jgi:predicted dienelactone hydrolase